MPLRPLEVRFVRARTGVMLSPVNCEREIDLPFEPDVFVEFVGAMVCAKVVIVMRAMQSHIRK